jgi:hypothetical protein
LGLGLVLGPARKRELRLPAPSALLGGELRLLLPDELGLLLLRLGALALGTQGLAAPEEVLHREGRLVLPG